MAAGVRVPRLCSPLGFPPDNTAGTRIRFKPNTLPIQLRDVGSLGTRISMHHTRRHFLRVGAAGLFGLTLTDLLRADAKPGRKAKAAGVIQIWLGGGASTIDMWDLKPDAPANIRGEFRPIPTKADGVQICEHLAKTAGVMDRCAIVRSLSHEITRTDRVRCTWPRGTCPRRRRSIPLSARWPRGCCRRPARCRPTSFSTPPRRRDIRRDLDISAPRSARSRSKGPRFASTVSACRPGSRRRN